MNVRMVDEMLGLDMEHGEQDYGAADEAAIVGKFKMASTAAFINRA